MESIEAMMEGNSSDDSGISAYLQVDRVHERNLHILAVITMLVILAEG